MDFEIEGDDDYDFEWSSTNNNNNAQKKKTSSFFGGEQTNEEEDGYNFSYENNSKPLKKYEPFSPVGQSHVVSKSKEQPKQVLASSQDAMERAQSMLNKYSNKSLSVPASNFKNQKIRKFNEDDMSMSSSDGGSDFEMSESHEDFSSSKRDKNAKGKKPAGKDINALDSKAHVVISMGEKDDEDDDSDNDYRVDSPPLALKKQAAQFSRETMDDSDGGDDDDASEYSDEKFDPEDNENSVEESAEEVAESRLSQTVDTEVDMSKSRSRNSSPDRDTSRSRSAMSESYSPTGDNNASYSRLVYGNEGEEEDEDEVGSDHSGVEASQSSKPNVFSFADLLSQNSWDAENPNKSTSVVPTKTKSASDIVKSGMVLNGGNPQASLEAIAAKTGVILPPVSSTSASVPVLGPAARDKQEPADTTKTQSTNNKEVSPSISSGPALLQPGRADSPPVAGIASVPTRGPATEPSAHSQVGVSTSSGSYGSSDANPTIPASVSPVPPAAQPLQPIQPSTAYPMPSGSHPVNPYPGYPPTAPAPVSQASPIAPVGQNPLYYQSPYGYGAPPPIPQYPYGPPPPHCYHPYSYPPSPYMYVPPPDPSLYGGQPCRSHNGDNFSPEQYRLMQTQPRWSKEFPGGVGGVGGSVFSSHASFPAPLSVDPRVSYLRRSRTEPLQHIASVDRDVSQQPLVLDLLYELRKSKEEADWAKQKLAEMVVRLGGSNPPGTGSPTKSKKLSENSSKTDKDVDSSDVAQSPPARPSLRFSSPVASAKAPAQAPVPVQSRASSTTAVTKAPAREQHESDDEVSEDEEYSYSSDFDEDSPTKPTTAAVAAAKRAKQTSYSISGSADERSYSYSFDEADPSVEEEKKSEVNIPKSHHNDKRHDIEYKTEHATQRHQKSRQLDPVRDTASGPVSDLCDGPVAELRDRARVMNPVRESLAHSLLASQELFKSQLESLRMRISATNTYTDMMQQKLNAQWDEMNTNRTSASTVGIPLGSSAASTRHAQDAAHALLFDDLNRTSFTAAPTLDNLRSQFESNRATSSEKMLDLLAQVYPSMTVAEARRLVAKL